MFNISLQSKTLAYRVLLVVVFVTAFSGLLFMQNESTPAAEATHSCMLGSASFVDRVGQYFCGPWYTAIPSCGAGPGGIVPTSPTPCRPEPIAPFDCIDGENPIPAQYRVIQSCTPQAHGTPTISVTPASQNFGSVDTGSQAFRSFVVENTGSGTLNGSVVGLTGRWSCTTNCAYSLDAAETTTVGVRFSPIGAGADSDTANFSGGGGASRAVSGNGVLPSAGVSTQEFFDVGSFRADWFKTRMTASWPNQVSPGEVFDVSASVTCDGDDYSGSVTVTGFLAGPPVEFPGPPRVIMCNNQNGAGSIGSLSITAPGTVGTYTRNFYVNVTGYTAGEQSPQLIQQGTIQYEVVASNQAPSVPTVAGPVTGITGSATGNFTFSNANDPENDDIRYQVDWGDGSPLEYLPGAGYVADLSSQTRNHTFASANTFSVRVRAEDDNGNVSGWSADWDITISNASVPANITNFSDSPDPINLTDSTTLTWTAIGDISSCSFRDTVDNITYAGPYLPSDSDSGTPISLGAIQYELTCYDGGSNDTAFTTVQVNPPANVTISASVTSGLAGYVTEVTYNAAGHVGTCLTSNSAAPINNWGGNFAAGSGDQVVSNVGPINVNTILVIWCDLNGNGGIEGGERDTQILFAMTPSIDLFEIDDGGGWSSVGGTVTEGSTQASLQWTTTDVSNCTISSPQDNIGPVADDDMSGTQNTSNALLNANSPHTYTLSCDGETATVDLTVDPVTPAPTVNFNVSDSFAGPFSSAETIIHSGTMWLTLTTSDATSCTKTDASSFWTLISNEAFFPAARDFNNIDNAGLNTFSIECTGPTGLTTPASVDVTVGAAPMCTLGTEKTEWGSGSAECNLLIGQFAPNGACAGAQGASILQSAWNGACVTNNSCSSGSFEFQYIDSCAGAGYSPPNINDFTISDGSGAPDASNSGTVILGTSARLDWDITPNDGPGCSLVGYEQGNPGNVVDNIGNIPLSPNIDFRQTNTSIAVGTYTYTLDCGLGGTQDVELIINAPLPPTMNLSLVPPGQISNNTQATVAWTSDGDSCEFDAGFGPDLDTLSLPNSNVTTDNTTSNLIEDTTIRITCYNGPTPATRELTVGVLPEDPVLVASETLVIAGGTSDFSWGAINGTNVECDGFRTLGENVGWATPVGSPPDKLVGGGSETLTFTLGGSYRLDCRNIHGAEASNVVTITVLDPEGSITALPEQVLKGRETTVVWQATSVQAGCDLTQEIFTNGTGDIPETPSINEDNLAVPVGTEYGTVVPDAGYDTVAKQDDNRYDTDSVEFTTDYTITCATNDVANPLVRTVRITPFIPEFDEE